MFTNFLLQFGDDVIQTIISWGNPPQNRCVTWFGFVDFKEELVIVQFMIGHTVYFFDELVKLGACQGEDEVFNYFSEVVKGNEAAPFAVE